MTYATHTEAYLRVYRIRLQQEQERLARLEAMQSPYALNAQRSIAWTREQIAQLEAL